MSGDYILPLASGIRFKLKVIEWWQPLYLMCKPVIEIDGVAHPARWGEQDIYLPAATHKVRVYFPYLWMKECGLAVADIAVDDGSWAPAPYTPPFAAFQRGRLKVGRV